MGNPLIGLQSIGQRIRIARESAGLRQADLAQRIGVHSAGVISNWEVGIAKPDIGKLVALCRALHVPPAYLLGYYEDAPEIPLRPENAEELRILALVRELSPENQRFLIAWLETAASQKA